MQIVADLHIHSKYSRAVSQKMDLYEIAKNASLKGIRLVSTGDWTHPLWIRHIQDSLKEINAGVYVLKKQPLTQKHYVNFLLTTEISSIYTQGDKVRRIHNLIFSPSIETCLKVNQKLEKKGANIRSDGRPIVGFSSKDLLEMLLEIDQNILFVPCHAWTPWFSIFGSKSGFDSIEECFGKENAKHIYAVETGLSSDPIMNWQIKELENRSIISSSDAHSGPKLGREATVFVSKNKLSIIEFAYKDIMDAIKQEPDSKLKIGFTIEFFPEEGKYHWSGHRACNIRYNALEVKEKGEMCPVCHKPLTIGVENRVLDLSSKIIDQEDLLFVKNKADLTFVYDKEKKKRPFVSLIPLLEVLIETQAGSPTKGFREYERITENYGTEFDILMRKPYDELEKIGGIQLKNAIEIVRNRKAFIDPGYDGVFGVVKIFQNKSSHENE
ncbi:MAG: endonuclease Q family protein [bacterium]|nr:endonuclease Q family protein [bacterium]